MGSEWCRLTNFGWKDTASLVDNACVCLRLLQTRFLTYLDVLFVDCCYSLLFVWNMLVTLSWCLLISIAVIQSPFALGISSRLAQFRVFTLRQMAQRWLHWMENEGKLDKLHRFILSQWFGRKFDRANTVLYFGWKCLNRPLPGNNNIYCHCGKCTSVCGCVHGPASEANQ